MKTRQVVERDTPLASGKDCVRQADDFEKSVLRQAVAGAWSRLAAKVVEASGYSNIEIALDLGIDKSLVSRWSSGKRMVSVTQIAKLLLRPKYKFLQLFQEHFLDYLIVSIVEQLMPSTLDIEWDSIYHRWMQRKCGPMRAGHASDELDRLFIAAADIAIMFQD